MLNSQKYNKNSHTVVDAIAITHHSDYRNRSSAETRHSWKQHGIHSFMSMHACMLSGWMLPLHVYRSSKCEFATAASSIITPADVEWRKECPRNQIHDIRQWLKPIILQCCLQSDVQPSKSTKAYSANTLIIEIWAQWSDFGIKLIRKVLNKYWNYCTPTNTYIWIHIMPSPQWTPHMWTNT